MNMRCCPIVSWVLKLVVRMFHIQIKIHIMTLFHYSLTSLHTNWLHDDIVHQFDTIAVRNCLKITGLTSHWLYFMAVAPWPCLIHHCAIVVLLPSIQTGADWPYGHLGNALGPTILGVHSHFSWQFKKGPNCRENCFCPGARWSLSPSLIGIFSIYM